MGPIPDECVGVCLCILFEPLDEEVRALHQLQELAGRNVEMVAHGVQVQSSNEYGALTVEFVVPARCPVSNGVAF